MNNRAERIKSAIAASGKSLRLLAEETGITASTLSRYAAGITDIPADSIPLLAKALAVNPYYLLCWEDDADRPVTKEDQAVIDKYIDAMRAFDANGIGPEKLLGILSLFEDFENTGKKKKKKK